MLSQAGFVTEIRMQDSSLQTVKEHWGHTLGCAPSKILSDGITVTPWNRKAVEVLVWSEGAVIGAPDYLTVSLREQSQRVSFDVTCDDIRQMVAPFANVDAVLGPQFVGYCDQTMFSPVDSDAERIEPSRLKSLRDDCPKHEWSQSAIQIDCQGRPTFAVLRDGQPIAATQLSSDHGVAIFATITHPRYRNQSHGKAVVSRAVDTAFEQGLLPEYRTVEQWSASVGLAEALGFEQTARSILVQLSETK